MPMNPTTNCFAALCIHVFPLLPRLPFVCIRWNVGFYGQKNLREKRKIETFELWKLRLRYDDEAGSAERQVFAQRRVFV